MNFQDLHELLRIELLRRINLGLLTGTGLAHKADFRQAHISNFLNRKRSLSLEGLDRVLAAQDLTVEQILPIEVNAVAPTTSPGPVEAVPLVSSSSAMNELVVGSDAVIETVMVATACLQETRSRASRKHTRWQRFVAIRADKRHAAAMEPLVPLGAIIVVDRHYRSLAPYRVEQKTLYAVRSASALVLRYLEFAGGQLILRPLALESPIQVLALAPHETPSDYIVGRVCLVISEH